MVLSGPAAQADDVSEIQQAQMQHKSCHNYHHLAFAMFTLMPKT